MAWDTHRDLAACLTWKQVWLGFPSLVSRLVEARRRVVHVASSLMLRRSKSKTYKLMRWAPSDSATLTLPFSFY
jgi:hypothetical protein